MPATVTQKYSHDSHYSLEDLSLTPHRKNEQRLIPDAYTPKTGTMQLEKTKARLEIEYSISETPGTEVKVFDGVKVVFGKYTKKVLEVNFEYASVNSVLVQMSATAKAITDRQSSVPQESIRKNYQMVSQVLSNLQGYIKQDWKNFTKNLDKASSR